MGHSFYRCCWHEFSSPLFLRYPQNLSKIENCSLRKALYTPKGFFVHAASLHQAFAHCGRFSTAASRRSEARISVPLLGVRLSPPLPVIALVVHYTTNKLIGRRLLSKRKNLYPYGNYLVLARISPSYARLQGRYLRVTNPFATLR